MAQLFDVIYFGLQDDIAPATAAQKLAQTFGLPLEVTTTLVNKPAGTVIKKAVTQEVAQGYQVALTNAGVKANYKPNATLHLELVAIEKTTVSCPNCSHEFDVSEDEAHPELCPNCGIVFAKLEKNEQHEQEREEIRARLQKIKEMQDTEEQRKQQEAAAESRRKLFEEQLRREMGLPTIVNTPTKLFSAATLTLLLGVGVGVLVPKLFLTEESLETSAENGLKLSTNPSVGGPIDVAPLTALSQELIAQSNSNSGVDPFYSDAAPVGVEQSTPKTAAAAQLQQLNLPDPEWDAFMQARVQIHLDANQFERAEQLSQHIRTPLAWVTTRGQFLIAATRAQHPAATTILPDIMKTADSMATGAQRVALLTAPIPALVTAQLPVIAEQLLVQANQRAADIVSTGGGTALSWAYLATAQAQLRHSEDAQQSIRRAMTALREPLSIEQRMIVTGQLAVAFYHLTALNDAHTILTQAQTTVAAVQSVPLRDAALHHLVRAWIEIDQLERGLTLSAQLSVPAERDQLLFDVLQQRALAGQNFGLSSIAEVITDPAPRARAYALLGRSAAPATAASEHFQRAVSLATSITDPLLHALTLAEIGRLQTRTARPAGLALFADAEKQLRTVPAGRAQDVGWARLAAQRLRALDTGAVQTYVANIRDAQVLTAVRRDVEQVTQTVRVW